MRTNSKKVTQIVNYLVSSKPNHELDKWSIVKLAYLADRYHLRQYGRTVSGDLYVAMKKGPVGSLIKDVIECTDYLADKEIEYVTSYLTRKEGAKEVVSSLGAVDLEQFSKTDIEALNFAIENFSKFSKEELIEITHQYPEWKKFQTKLESDSTIEKMNYEDFFLNPDTPEDLFAQSNETLDSSKDMFFENEKCSTVFSDVN